MQITNYNNILYTHIANLESHPRTLVVMSDIYRHLWKHIENSVLINLYFNYSQHSAYEYAYAYMELNGCKTQRQARTVSIQC